jgi:16S rRNA (guanine527-N7)-methyltransferase
MIPKEYFKEITKNYGFDLTEEQIDRFDRYAEYLVEWNEKINLTAITDPKEICIKHFLDSLLFFKAVSLPEKASLIDVGTGAGFPSVPCKIVRPDLSLTLLDSLNKRIQFLSGLSDHLGIETKCIHSRAEDGGKSIDLREKFDYATARAVAHLRELSEYCLPFVKPGGYFIALKGYEIEQELEEAKKAIKLLGGEIKEVKKYELPEENRRGIVVIQKISQTPTKYPRMAAKIKKQPIK